MNQCLTTMAASVDVNKELTWTCFIRALCCSVCWFLYGPFCHGALQQELSRLWYTKGLTGGGGGQNENYCSYTKAIKGKQIKYYSYHLTRL